MPRIELSEVLKARAAGSDAEHDSALRLVRMLEAKGLDVEHLGTTGPEFTAAALDAQPRLPGRRIVRPIPRTRVDWTTWDPERARG